MTHTLKTLEENYQTWCALTGNAPSEQPVREMVLEALAAAEVLETRAIKIDLDTFFQLLLEFNKRGIHFANASTGAKIGAGANTAGGDLADVENLFVDAGNDDDED